MGNIFSFIMEPLYYLISVVLVGWHTLLSPVFGADDGVTWIHSYVSTDKRKTFCVYDGPDPETIRRAADRNGLPIEQITRVSVLDPYFYHRAPGGHQPDGCGPG